MAWQENIIADVISNIPLTSAVIDGALFIATDTGEIYRNDLGGAGWVLVLTAGGSPGWALAGTGYTAAGVWQQSVDGTTASPLTFTDLGDYSEVQVLVSQLDKTASSTIRVEVGYDGPTWLSTDEYVVLDDAGDESTSTNFSLDAGANTDPVSGYVRITGFNLAAPKPCLVPNRDPEVAWYINDVNPLNRVRVQTSTGSGDFNGGAVYVLAKP